MSFNKVMELIPPPFIYKENFLVSLFLQGKLFGMWIKTLSLNGSSFVPKLGFFVFSSLAYIYIYIYVYFQENNKICSGLYVISMFIFMCQVCWMFNEGFFQFRQIVFVFHEKTYIWAYFLFGYGKFR